MFQETLKLQQDIRKKKQEMLEKQIEWQKVRETHTHAHRVNLCISLSLLTALSTRNNRNTVVSLFIPPSFPAVFSPHSSLPFLPSSTFLTPPLSCYLLISSPAPGSDQSTGEEQEDEARGES